MEKIIKKIFDVKKTGLIYDMSWGTTQGEVFVAIKKAAKVAYHVTRVLGSGLIVAGVAGVIFTFKPVVTSELKYRLDQFSTQKQAERQKEEDLIVEAANKDEQHDKELAQKLGMSNTYFSVYIPKIDAKAPIVENVDSSSPTIYMKALHQGVAHASGSVFPGMDGATFLFAHSSTAPWDQAQYNSVFYLLRQLEPPKNAPGATPQKNVPLGGGLIDQGKGDEVYIFFLDKLYKYEVTEKHIVDPNDVSWLANAQTGDERLILQTCWPPGTALKRLIIVAKRVKS
jgi:sortase (surface protein transpeptidase)